MVASLEGFIWNTRAMLSVTGDPRSHQNFDAKAHSSNSITIYAYTFLCGTIGATHGSPP